MKIFGHAWRGKDYENLIRCAETSNEDSTFDRLVSELKSQPEAVILLRHIDNDLVNTPGDTGVWCTNGIIDLQTKISMMVRVLKSNGVNLRYVYVSSEEHFTMWGYRYDRGEPNFLEPSLNLSHGEIEARSLDNTKKLFADPRFPELGVPSDITPESLTYDWPRINRYASVMRAQMNKTMNAAIYWPIQEIYPDCQVNRYLEWINNDPERMIPDLNGHIVQYDPPLFGNTQGPDAYGTIHNYRRPDGKPWDAYSGMIDCLNRIRAAIRNHPAPVIPWFAPIIMEGPTIANSPYYRALIHHVFLSGCPRLAFWNPPHISPDAINEGMNNMIKEVEPYVNGNLPITGLTHLDYDVDKIITRNSKGIAVTVPPGTKQVNLSFLGNKYKHVRMDGVHKLMKV